jgi:hypothetical protein
MVIMQIAEKLSLFLLNLYIDKRLRRVYNIVNKRKDVTASCDYIEKSKNYILCI